MLAGVNAPRYKETAIAIPAFVERDRLPALGITEGSLSISFNGYKIPLKSVILLFL